MEEYSRKQIILDHLRNNKKQLGIDLKALSINGKCVRDDMETYLRSKNISSTDAEKAQKSPLLFYYDYNTKPKEEKKESKHFEVGTFSHMAFLESVLFKSVKVLPTVNQATLEGCRDLLRSLEKINGLPKEDVTGLNIKVLRSRIKELKGFADSSGIRFVDEETKYIIGEIEKNYYRYGMDENGTPLIPQLLKGGLCEVSFYGVDYDTKLPVKVRTDCLNVAENIGVNAIISFKTTGKNSLEEFFSDCAKFGYDTKEAMYQEVISNITGREFDTTITILLQTVPPYDVAVLIWDNDDIEAGKYKYHLALDLIKECLKKKKFIGFESRAESGSRGIIEMRLPEWTKKERLPIEIDI